MNYHKLSQCVLDIGEEMLVAGAEVSRVTDSLERMISAYGCEYRRINAFVITSNIQITFETPDGDIVTQIRMVTRNKADFDRLDYLNSLSRYICANKPEIKEIQELYEEIMERPSNPLWLRIFGILMIGVGFTIFFEGGLIDACVAGVIGLLAVFLERKIAEYDSNVMAKLFIVSMIASTLTIVVYELYPYINTDKVMIGVIMLFIPGIAITNSVRDLLIGDMVAGMLRLTNAILLALTIAIGFGLPMMVFTEILGVDLKLLASMRLSMDYSVGIEMLAALVGSVGFAIYINMKGKQIAYAGIGGMLTWGVYLFMSMFFTDYFIPNLIASIFVGIFAEIMAKVNRAPATVFLISAAVPLVPGGALFYATEGFIFADYSQMETMAYKCISIALAISLGFVVIAIWVKYINLLKNRLNK